MTSPQLAALTQAHRRQQAAFAKSVAVGVLAYWRTVDPTAVDKAWPAVAKAIAHVISTGHAKSAAQAGIYLRQHAALAGVVLTHVDHAVTLPAAQIETSLLVTGPVALKIAARSGQNPTNAHRIAGVRLIGAASRLVLDGGRSTVLSTVASQNTTDSGSDSPSGSQFVGFQRVGSGDDCDFCEMLIERGAVYHDADTAAGDSYHDHCACTAEPVYS